MHARAWGPPYILAMRRWRRKRVWIPQPDACYRPWNTPGFVRKVENLEQATQTEVIEFVRQYGFLGYPEERVLGGEPLGWLRHQGRRMRYMVTLFQALRTGRADPVKAICKKEGLETPNEWLLPKRQPPDGESGLASDALRLYVLWGDNERGEGGFRPPKGDEEWLRAVRTALQDEFQALTKRILLGLVEAVWNFRASPQPALRLRWDASLLDTVLLGEFLGVYTKEGSPRFCPVCATPYISLKADCGDPHCEMARKKRQQRLQSELKTEKHQARRLRKIRQFILLLSPEEITLLRREVLSTQKARATKAG